MAIIDLVLQALWFILPAYFANSSPVIIAKLTGAKYPIDAGKKFFDKLPIFGAGKTWPGLIGGILIGTFIGFLQSNLQLGLLLGIGALTGDLVKSFFKRRFGLERGKSLPVIDQLDFLIGALLFASFITKIELSTVVILLIITPIIHLSANGIAHFLKLKKEWY